MRKLLLKWFGEKDIKETYRTNEPSMQLGCVRGEEDVRDHPCTVFDTGYPTLSEAYIIPQLPPIRNQEKIGSCCSHAVIGAYETMILNTKPRRFMEGSELYHYWNARHKVSNTGDRDSGMTIRDGCKTINKFHMATENLWPYNILKFNLKPSWLAYAMAGAYKIKEYQRLNSLNEIKVSLCVENNPVIVGLQAKKSLFPLNKKGYLYVPQGESRGGHAVLIIGYDDKKEVFIIRNSWGTRWGNEGNFEMKYTDFKTYSFDWFRILL